MRSNYKKIGGYIREVNNRDSEMNIDLLLGVSIQKKFIPSIANTIGTDMSTYKIIKRNQFVYGPVTSRNGDKISIALLKEYKQAIVSQAYRSFEIIDTNELLPEYLMMWFCRPEFDRYARFMSHGSTREVFDWDEMCDTELPIPSIEKQREIVKEYNVVKDRIELNNKLIQKLEETAQAIYKQWFVDFEFPDENGNSYKSSSGEMVWCEELEKEVPRGWEVGKIDDIKAFINRGITPSYLENEGVVILNQKCVRNNSIEFEHARKHNVNNKKIPDEKFLRQFDILVNSTGDGTLGRVGIVKEISFPLTVDSHITILRTNAQNNPLYVWGNISGRSEEIAKLAEGSTGQTELSRSMFSELPILIPELNMQNHFAEVIEKTIRHSCLLEEESQKLTKLKDLLLSKLATFN